MTLVIPVLKTVKKPCGANQRPLNQRIIPYPAPYSIIIKGAKKRFEDLRRETSRK